MNTRGVGARGRSAAMPLLGAITLAAALSGRDPGVIPAPPPAPLAGCSREIVAVALDGEGSTARERAGAPDRTFAGCRDAVARWLEARGCAAGGAAARASRGRPDDGERLEVNLHAGACEVRIGRLPAAARTALGLRLDVNAATATELETLGGIGPALAERIVASRERDGPFREVEELDRVRGIGPALVERLRPFVTAE